MNAKLKRMNKAKDGVEYDKLAGEIEELEMQKIALQRRREAVVSKYKTKLNLYRLHLLDQCHAKVEQLLIARRKAALLDRFTDTEDMTSAQVQKAIDAIEALEKEIKALEDKYL